MREEVNITYNPGTESGWLGAKSGDVAWWALLAGDAILGPRWHRVKRHPNGCWLLQMAGTNHAGHITLGSGSDRVAAHRRAYQLAYGRIPSGRVVRHACDDPACLYPGHLLVGSQRENVYDCMERDRRNAWGRQRLVSASVLDIRARHLAGETQKALAAEYGVSKGCVHAVVHGLTWRHLARSSAHHARQFGSAVAARSTQTIGESR